MNFGVQIRSITIADAWEKFVVACMEKGVETKTGRGLREDALSLLGGQIIVEEPLTEPMVSDKFVNDRTFCENYALEYLLLDNKQPDEDYTYGSQIYKKNQLNNCIAEMKKDPHRRDFILEIGEPKLFGVKDPPCLRLIDFRVLENVLHTFFYFRSWDIFKASNANLLGIARLAEYVTKEVGGLEVGQLVGFFKDAHIYARDLDYAKKTFSPKKVNRR